MSLTAERMLDRFYARDAAYDGRFITGVLSTGIYCLPSCRARKPKQENLRFFNSPAEAEAAGFRPCRRCRPDDFYRRYDPEREAVLELTRRIREEPGAYATVEDLARALDMSTTHLNDLFHRFYHRSAGWFLTEARVHKACRLLAATDERVLEIGAASGYASLSSFNENFRKLTGMSPAEYRRLRDSGAFVLRLPGWEAAWALRFQGRDGESLCERHDGVALTKALTVEGQPVVLKLTALDGVVYCQAESASQSAVDMFQVHAIALRLLGAAPDPSSFARTASQEPRLRALVKDRPRLRIPQTATVFEGLCWAIIGQQISLPSAYQLRRNLARLAGTPLASGLFTHPTPAAVAALDYADLQRLRFSRRKAEYLIDAARSIVSGVLPVESFSGLPADEVQERLLGVRGIGVWSSNYLGMRSCGLGDCAPIGDTGLAAGLQRYLGLSQKPDGEETRRLMEGFKPFRSFVTFHLWQTLGGGG